MKTIPEDYKVRIPYSCELVSSDSSSYTLKNLDDGKMYTYPSSEYLRFNEGNMGKTKYKANSIVAEVVLPLPPTLKLEMVIKLIGANSTMAGNRLTRAEVTVTDSHSVKGGKLTYDFKNRKVKVGSDIYNMDDDAAYYYPDGATIPPRTKFRSGIMTPKMTLPQNPLPKDIEDSYQIFRSQILEIMGQDSVNEELMEVIFRACLVDGEFHSVTKAVIDSASPLAAISYGHASKSITEVLKEPRVINDDPMSSVLLNYMLKDAAYQTLDDDIVTGN